MRFRKSKATVEVKTVCQRCGGTGLYKGMAELGTSAVVCRTCGGTGCEKIKYTPFKKIEGRTDITKVFARGGFYAVDENISGGVAYEEWASKPGSVRELGKEARDLYCPMLWYHFAPVWEECPPPGAPITKCEHYPRKEDCWERYDSLSASGVSFVTPMVPE